MPGRQRRNKTMQFSIQRNLLDDLAAIGFEGSAEVVDIDPAEFGHQPVGAARRDAAQPEVIDAAFAPSADNVVTLGNLFEKNRNVARVVLQIAIHRNNVFAASVIKTGG